MRRRITGIGVLRFTAVWLVAGFGLGALVAVIFGLSPWWYLASLCAMPGLSLPVRYLIERHIARTPYDGNDRSRIFPAGDRYRD
jgi:hypothetical protein